MESSPAVQAPNRPLPPPPVDAYPPSKPLPPIPKTTNSDNDDSPNDSTLILRKVSVVLMIEIGLGVSMIINVCEFVFLCYNFNFDHSKRLLKGCH